MSACWPIWPNTNDRKTISIKSVEALPLSEIESNGPVEWGETNETC